MDPPASKPDRASRMAQGRRSGGPPSQGLPPLRQIWERYPDRFFQAGTPFFGRVAGIASQLPDRYARSARWMASNDPECSQPRSPVISCDGSGPRPDQTTR
jgi:hypothetical protein